MKPFNLQEALSNQEKFGDPKVVTREGTPMKEKFVHWPALGEFCVCSVNPRKGIIASWTEAGKYYSDLDTHPYDLFMAPTKVTKWVNVRRDGHGDIAVCSCLYNTEAEAKANGEAYSDKSYRYSTHQITLEE